MMNDKNSSELIDKINEVFESNNAIMLATTGGSYSPWILGAYYTTEELSIYLLLEKGGKSFANLDINKNVAYSISQNDATKDFIQGQAVVTVLPDEDEPKVREMLLKKMPWYRTFVPMVPIRIDSKKIFVTSLKKNWFPARVLEQ